MAHYKSCESCIFNLKVNSLEVGTGDGVEEATAALQTGFNQSRKMCRGYRPRELRFASRLSLLHQAAYSFALEPRDPEEPIESDITRVVCNNEFKHSRVFKEIIARFDIVELPPDIASA